MRRQDFSSKITREEWISNYAVRIIEQKIKRRRNPKRQPHQRKDKSKKSRRSQRKKMMKKNASAVLKSCWRTWMPKSQTKHITKKWSSKWSKLKLSLISKRKWKRDMHSKRQPRVPMKIGQGLNCILLTEVQAQSFWRRREARKMKSKSIKLSIKLKNDQRSKWVK